MGKCTLGSAKRIMNCYSKMLDFSIRGVPCIEGPKLGGGWGGIAIGVPAKAFSLYIYFTNENRSVKADFC